MAKPVKLASHDSPLGQLQRGRGAGYQRALNASKNQASDWLFECIMSDPRFDSQVENREDYYAALAIDVGLDLEPLSEYLRGYDDLDQTGWNTPLTVTTLGKLAKRGCAAALPILCDYIVWGEWWNWPLDDLVASRDPAIVAQVAWAIEQRSATDEKLEDALRWEDFDREPWVQITQHSPRITKLAAKCHKRIGSQVVSPEPAPNYTSLSTVRLLELVNERNQYDLCKVIAQVAKPADVDLLVASVSPERPFVAGVALAGLARLAPPSAFGWLRKFWESNPEMPGVVRRRASEVFVALPSELTLPLAREWLNQEAWHQRILAEEVLEKHATQDDVPLLRTAIAQALADQENQCYRLCNLAEAFTHLSGWGDVPELNDIFVQFGYSYGRKRVAKAMAVTAPNSFRQRFAEECLWDCEEETRVLGVNFVPLQTAPAEVRLQMIASDLFEETEVRCAANERLQKRDNS